MFKTIVRIFVCVLLLIGVLYIGGTSISKIGHDVEFKSPVKVFQPLAAKFGLNLNISDEGNNNSGSIIVSAETGDDESNSNSSSNSSNNSSNGSNSGSNSSTSKSKKPHGGGSFASKPGIFNFNVFITHKPADKENYDKKLTVADLDALIATIRISDGNSSNYTTDMFELPVQVYEYNGAIYLRQEYEYLNGNICPYTGLEYDKTKLTYNHFIPIEYIIKYGNIDWTPEQCNEYAYSELTGTNVQIKAAKKKANRGPVDWLPDTNLEDYCYTWLVLASKYDIALRREDINMCRLQCMNAVNNGNILHLLGGVNNEAS